ncbi:hypothetical protein Tco_0982881 [Tanacetum coccineum]
MEISIADQIALDDALVAPANRLKIAAGNFPGGLSANSKKAPSEPIYPTPLLHSPSSAFITFSTQPPLPCQTTPPPPRTSTINSTASSSSHRHQSSS